MLFYVKSIETKGKVIFDEIFQIQKKRISSALLNSKSEEVLNFDSVLNRIINQDAYFEEAHYELGKAYILVGQYKKASSVLTDYLLLSPNNKDGYYYLGEAYIGLNKYNFAKDAFNKVVAIDELYSNAHYYLGLIFESIL